ncbi:MAG: HEAT repeat domain-containing protein [Methylotenera sp.]|nr:HEAT repeat domain-containing protein [Oligoflexia bacterium]
MFSHRKVQIIITSVTGLGVLTAVALTRRSPPPNPDEFFKQNSHLTRPEARVAPEAPKVRTSDDFLADDYHLIEGSSFPVLLKNKMNFASGQHQLINSSYVANLKLHSLGMKNRKLELIAEFDFEHVEGSGKLSPTMKAALGFKGAVKAGENLFLVRLDPAGKIDEIYSSSAAGMDDTTAELKVNALMMIFRRLPALQVGVVTRTEGDEQGIPYPIQYTMTAVGSDVIKIVGDVKVRKELGTTTKKAAAAGAPLLSVVSLENDQHQSFDWLWNKKSGHPDQQDFSASAAIRQYGQDVSATQAILTAQWKPEEKSKFTREDAKAFKMKLDFKRLTRLNGSLAGDKKKFSKKGLLGPSWEEIQKRLGNLRDPNMSEKEKDQLFTEMARAVKNDPALIETARDIGVGNDPNSPEISMALGALGFEGSPASQAAMIDIYNRPGTTDENRQKVMTEFALNSRPLTPETKKFVVNEYKKADPMTSDTASGAGLAIGASIAHDGDPESVKLLRSEWDKSSGLISDDKQKEDKKIYLLTAMGNSKSNVFLPETKAAADSKRAEMRSAAVDSVRFAQDQSSRDVLFKALETDPTPEVKVTAAQSLRYQPFDSRTRTALENCSASGADLGVKLECYRVLTSSMDQPGVRQFLESRANVESDPQVKGLLRAALEMKAQ